MCIVFGLPAIILRAECQHLQLGTDVTGPNNFCRGRSRLEKPTKTGMAPSLSRGASMRVDAATSQTDKSARLSVKFRSCDWLGCSSELLRTPRSSEAASPPCKAV